MSDLKNIPEGWEETTLEKVTNYISRGIPPKYTESKGIYVLNQRCIRNNIVSYENARIHDINLKKVSDVKYIQDGDVLICSTGVGTLGRVSQILKVDFQTTVDSHVTIVRGNDEIEKHFLGFLLRGKQREIEHLAEGSTGQTELPRRKLNEFLIEIPKDIKEQKSIASILTSFDEKIELLQAQNKTLETIAQTIFKEWFGKYQIGDELPNEVVKIKDFDVVVTDYVANGSFASLAENVTYNREEGYAKLIRLTDFNNSFNGDFIFVDEKAYDFLGKSKLFGGEVIISNVGAYAGTVFKCPKLESPMTLGPNSIVLISEFSNYFYLLFKSRIGKHLLASIIGGSAQPKFNKTTFRNIELCFPSKDYILDFESKVGPLMLKIEQNEKQIQTLSKTRDTLLPKLMSGAIRVNKKQKAAT